MEEKVLHLMEKMYSDFNQKFEKIDERFEKIDQRFEKIDQRFDKIDQRFDKMGKEIKSNRDEIKKIGTKIDGEVMPKLDALFDGYQQNTERIERLEHKVDDLTEKVVQQELEIRVIKNA